jgi:hypothetical protein
MKPITMTVYLYADEAEFPDKWDVAEWIGDPTIVGWEITEGHGECAACASQEHGVCSHEHASPDPEGCWWCHRCYTEVPSRKDW